MVVCRWNPAGEDQGPKGIDERARADHRRHVTERRLPVLGIRLCPSSVVPGNYQSRSVAEHLRAWLLGSHMSG